MNALGRLMGYAARHKGGLSIAFAIAIVGMLFELAKPWPLKVIVDYVLGDQRLPGWAIPAVSQLPGVGGQYGLLIWSIAILVVITLGSALLAYAATAMTVRLCYRMVFDMARELFWKLQKLSLGYHQKQSVGDLLQRMSQDVFAVHIAVSAVLLPATISALTLIGMFAILMSIDVVMALVSMIVLPGLIGALLFFAGPMSRATRSRYDQQAAFMGLVEQALSGIKIVQGYARERYLQGRMEKSAQIFGKAYNTDVRIGEAYKQTTMVVSGIATAAVLGIGAWRVFAGHLTLGDLLVFIGYLAAIYGPITAISTAVGAGIQAGSQSRRVFEVIDLEETVAEPAHPVPVDEIRGDIVFENVSFGYGEGEGRQTILHDISFTARRGEIIALVGATGMGKSTLVSLISRFYDPWTGSVSIDGHDLRELSLQTIRENVSLVLQEPFLFPVSIAENIAFGQSGVTPEQIEEAARIACADKFIHRLPDLYGTVVAERGGSLSGGERQRIAIARAVLKNSPILILDEPTSALDARTEATILQNLAETARKRTTFFISHRLSTIKRADKIIVLDEGRIVEVGRHEELMASGNVYSSLYRHQELAVL